MTRPFLLGMTLLVLTAACSKTSSPTAPTPPAAVTRIIRLGGNLNFGDVHFFTVSDGVFTVSNDGNDALQFNGIGYGVTAPNSPPTATNLRAWCFQILQPLSPTTFNVAPGETLSIGFRFAPVVALGITPRSLNDRFDCSGTFTVNSNQTSGTNTIAVTAIGTP